MAGIVSQVITKYYELVEERNELKMKNTKLKKALSLTNKKLKKALSLTKRE